MYVTFDHINKYNACPRSFSKGADGCIRSKDTNTAGYRQYCCYNQVDGEYSLIGPGEAGAGWPRKTSHAKDNTDKLAYVDCEKCQAIECAMTLFERVRRGSNAQCYIKGLLSVYFKSGVAC